MNLFTDLINKLAKCDSQKSKVEALTLFFKSELNSSDIDTALNLLLDNNPKRVISTRQLKEWATDLTNIPDWLISRSEQEVGNFLETFNLLLGAHPINRENNTLANWLLKMNELQSTADEKTKQFIHNELSSADTFDRLILLKLMTGNFKSPVSRHEIALSLADVLSLETEIISLRLYKQRMHKNIFIDDLKKQIEEENELLPLAFSRIVPITKTDFIHENYSTLKAFGKIDGIEMQLVKHGSEVHLWTRQGDIITDKFPEIISAISNSAPNCKIFGQIVTKDPNDSIAHLTKRLNKKDVTNKDVKGTESAIEIWEIVTGEIDTTNTGSAMKYLQHLHYSSFKELQSHHKHCKSKGFSGILFKKINGAKYYYWKAKSFSINAVLMNVEFGNINTSGVQSVTFGVYNSDEVVPIVKISNFEKHINSHEIVEFTKSNTLERFGPVRTVKLQLVYEIFFDDVITSSRRKSGLEMTNARISKKISSDLLHADALASLKKLL